MKITERWGVVSPTVEDTRRVFDHFRHHIDEFNFSRLMGRIGSIQLYFLSQTQPERILGMELTDFVVTDSFVYADDEFMKILNSRIRRFGDTRRILHDIIEKERKLIDDAEEVYARNNN